MLSKSNSKSGEETKKWFITKLCEKAVQFYHEAIYIDTHNHQYYVCLALILKELNRFDDALHWTNKVKKLNPQDERILGILGFLFGNFNKFVESV
jgi:tetratricopeptide (TPR) repeat protein